MSVLFLFFETFLLYIDSEGGEKHHGWQGIGL